MARGRKPKPVALKIHEGNRGKRRIPKEPNVPKLSSAPPKRLGKYGKELWRELHGLFAGVGVLRATDAAALELCCDSYDEWCVCMAEQSERDFEPYTCSKYGAWSEHPSIGRRRKAKQLFLRYAAELGITPVARARVSPGDGGGTGDELDDFLSKKNGA